MSACTRTRLEIRRAAQVLRFVPHGARWDPILDAASYASRVTAMRVLARPLPHAFDAILLSGRRQRPLLVVNVRHPRARRNFSIAHELGHWVLHAQRPSSDLSRSTRRRLEWEADQFAVELLLPVPLLRQVLPASSRDLTSLARRLSVAPATLRRRLRELTDAKLGCRTASEGAR